MFCKCLNHFKTFLMFTGLYTTPLSLIIRKHKGIKFHFYANDSQVYVHLSKKNTSAVFEKLNRCLDDVKEWMSSSKLKLNPDKTEFIIFGSKRQRDKLKACFPIDILGSSLCPLTQSKICMCGLIQIFPCPSMFRMSAIAVLLNSVISDMSAVFLLMMFLYLWLMLLLVFGWITTTHFSGASPSSIYPNYSVSKTVKLGYTSITSVLRNCIGFLLNSAQCLRQPHLFISFFTQVFLGILLHIFLPTAVLIIPGSVKAVAISLSLQSSTFLFINLSNSLVIVLLLMLPICGMLFQMGFVPLPHWPLSESSLKPTCTPKHTYLSLDP